jgi:hypothetical protein
VDQIEFRHFRAHQPAIGRVGLQIGEVQAPLLGQGPGHRAAAGPSLGIAQAAPRNRLARQRHLQAALIQDMPPDQDLA